MGWCTARRGHFAIDGCGEMNSNERSGWQILALTGYSHEEGFIHHKDTKNTKYQKQLFQTLLCSLQREVFKHFDEDSAPREDKIIHNKVAKAAKTNHCRSLVETVLSSWPLCPCCEISGYLVAAMPRYDLL